MSNRSKRIGTDAETAVANWFREHGYRSADRIAQKGSKDIGDVRLGDNYSVVIEVKAGKSAITALGSHMKELAAEVENANARTGVVIAKRRGTTDVGEWFAVMPVHEWLHLFALAGEGSDTG